jgi:hypothetical protein
VLTNGHDNSSIAGPQIWRKRPALPVSGCARIHTAAHTLIPYRGMPDIFNSSFLPLRLFKTRELLLCVNFSQCIENRTLVQKMPCTYAFTSPFYCLGWIFVVDFINAERCSTQKPRLRIKVAPIHFVQAPQSGRLKRSAHCWCPCPHTAAQHQLAQRRLLLALVACSCLPVDLLTRCKPDHQSSQ